MAQVPDSPLNSAGTGHTQSDTAKALKTELRLEPACREGTTVNWQSEPSKVIN